MSQPMLAEFGEPDAADDYRAAESLEINRLKDEISRLRRIINNLRTQLSPLYNGLKLVFGEIEQAGVSNEPASQVNSRVAALWETWKQRLRGHQANFIDALLIHGEMSAPQLRVAMKCAHQTVYDTAAKLNKLGLLDSRTKGRYSLKQL